MSEKRKPIPAPISDTVTISVAEYHFLTKAATLLEVAINGAKDSYDPVIMAIKATIESMQAGAEE